MIGIVLHWWSLAMLVLAVLLIAVAASLLTGCGDGITGPTVGTSNGSPTLTVHKGGCDISIMPGSDGQTNCGTGRVKR